MPGLAHGLATIVIAAGAGLALASLRHSLTQCWIAGRAIAKELRRG